ncbi:MAG: phosphonate C-P lyase system protein PhnH, partial [Rhizobiaceae bacterium]|nr:phosphonate C-P lyase system protein PhnH [Rhizobiaceae bacterium]
MEDLTNKASLDGGFEDVATESAGMFRAVLDAMSHPGTMQSQLTNLT